MTLSAVQAITQPSNESPQGERNQGLSLSAMNAEHLAALEHLVLTDAQRRTVPTPQVLANHAATYGHQLLAICRHGRPVGMLGFGTDQLGTVHLFGFQIGLIDQDQGIGGWALRNLINRLKNETPMQQIHVTIPKENMVAAAFFVGEGFRFVLPPRDRQNSEWYLVLSLGNS